MMRVEDLPIEGFERVLEVRDEAPDKICDFAYCFNENLWQIVNFHEHPRFSNDQ